jgi:enoyl-CoA hydratase
VHPVANLLDEAKKLARKVTSKGPHAIAACKEAMLAGQFLADAEAEAVERALFARCFGTADQKEGMGSFIEKRPAAFPRQFA